MKLQNKLTILFSLLALVPLLLVSYLGYLNQKDTLIKKTVQQLISVADIQERRVNYVIANYIEQLRLITSRTQLRNSVVNYNKDPNSESFKNISKIINDAKIGTPTIGHISVINLSGIVIASTDERLINTNYDLNSLSKKINVPHFDNLFYDENNLLKVRLFGPFLLNDEIIGSVEVTVDAGSLISITEDYSGLGNTGEVVIAEKNSLGDSVFITPLRFDSNAALRRAISKEKKGAAAVVATSGFETIITGEKSTDYRGERVFAVTRYIEALDWGLVVKMDQDEVLEPVRFIARSFFSVVFVSVFLIILLSFVVTMSITRPIALLTIMAHKIKSGNFNQRVKIETDNEIGLLADTFNGMSKDLSDLYSGLEKRIKERTKDIEEARAKDDAVLAGIGDGLIVTDKNGVITRVNEAFERILYFKSKDVVGKKLSDVISLADEKGNLIKEKDRLISKTLKKLNIERTKANKVKFYKRSDGHMVPVSIIVSPIVINSEVIGAVEVFRDISLERDIDNAKSEFVSLASHQLRTPLSAISWYTEMLLAGDAGKLNSEQKNHLKEIYKGNNRMVALVNALLNVSRLELGTFSVEPKKINPVDVLNNEINVLKPQIKKLNQKLSVEVDKSIGITDADQNLLSIIFQNVLSNAVKYTKDGGTIEVEFRKIEKTETIGGVNVKKGNFLYKVKDSGYGIPENQQEEIFTKLFRADNVRESDTDGTGLGLYIIKSIIEKIGGSIWFNSKESKGSTFYVVIPQNMSTKSGSNSLDKENN